MKVLAWPHRDKNTPLPTWKRSWWWKHDVYPRIRKKVVSSLPHFSFDYKTVAHQVPWVAPSHLLTCKPHKSPVLISHFLSTTLPLTEFFSALRVWGSELFTGPQKHQLAVSLWTFLCMFLYIHENCWIIIAPSVCWDFFTEHPNFYKSSLSHMGDVRELLLFGGEMVGNSHCIMVMTSLLLLLHFYLPRVLVTHQMSNKQLQASTDLFIRQFKWLRIVAVASVIAMCVSIVLSSCPIHPQNLTQLLSSRRRRLSSRQTNLNLNLTE